MSMSKEGWLKIKLHKQTKWHHKYCTIDWDKAVLFIATKASTRYRDWIQLSHNIIINELESANYSESHSGGVLSNTIEIIADNGQVHHYLQAETKADYDRWILSLRRAAFSRRGGAIFGQSLEDTHRYSRDETYVPLIVRQCCEYLLENGLTFVGIFRVPGKQSSIKALREMYDRGLSLDLNVSYSPATISSLLKLYLQSLPEPIIPTQSFDDFLQIGSVLKCNQKNELDRLKSLVETVLPPINFAVLAYLCRFLKQLTEHAETTKMDSENLAVVFGNNLIRRMTDVDLLALKGHSNTLVPLVKTLIDESDYIFPESSTSGSIDFYEQGNESVNKSSGLWTDKKLSASLPSLKVSMLSTYEDTSSSVETKLTQSQAAFEKKTLVGNQSLYIADQTDQLKTYQSSNSTKDQSVMPCRRSPSVNLLDSNRTDELLLSDQNRSIGAQAKGTEKSDIITTASTTVEPMKSIQNTDKSNGKKGLANKLGKSISNIRSTVSKALQNNPPQNDNGSQAPCKSSNTLSQSSLIDFQPTNDPSNKLASDIVELKEQLDQKEFLINELRKQCDDERSKFKCEKLQLMTIIDELRAENSQLKRQLEMQ